MAKSMAKSKKQSMFMVAYQWNITRNGSMVNVGVYREYVAEYPSMEELTKLHNKFAKKLAKFGYDAKTYNVALDTTLHVKRWYTYQNARGTLKHQCFEYELDTLSITNVIDIEYAYNVAYMFDHDNEQRIWNDVVFASSFDSAKPKYAYGSIVSIVRYDDMKVNVNEN